MGKGKGEVLYRGGSKGGEKKDDQDDTDTDYRGV